MSFLDQILKKKKTLNCTETVITRPDGSTYIETSQSRNAGEDPKLLTVNTKHGFVVDTKPDKIPAEIIQGLYLGSQDCADDSILNLNNITSVLSIGVDSNTSMKNKLFVECLDLPESNIDVLLNRTNVFINEALQNDGSVLVHCNAGVSRSATAVLGYLIQMKKYSFDDAYTLVKTKRPCIQPNAGFMRQLKVLTSCDL